MTNTDRDTFKPGWQLRNERDAIKHETYFARLVTCYGGERANAIIAGRDAAHNADVAAWGSLGQPKRGRAA